MKLFCIKDQISFLKKEYKNSFNSVLNSGKFILGKNVNYIEKKLSKEVGSKYCISTSSGTDALLISLMSKGIGKGDEVITTAFTYVSTVEVILRLGAKPVFVDIKKETGLINELEIKKKITKKTKAIIPVSLFGMIPNMDEINKISKNKNILVIEDGAQSFGSSYKNIKSCNLTDIGCTSFYPTKNLSAFGDGGAIFTNNKFIYEKCRLIRNHGEKKKYFTTTLGVCGRLDEIQASILISKLKIFKKERLKRISNGIKLKLILKKYCIKNTLNQQIAYNTFPILVNDRNKFIKKLKLNKIEFSFYYPVPVHKQPFLKLLNKKIILPNTDYYSKHILNLPVHPYLKKEYFKKIEKIFK
jgi:UDP-2-acetamido-2-deoxy-ribo-hexuluronate aminotransferase